MTDRPAVPDIEDLIAQARVRTARPDGDALQAALASALDDIAAANEIQERHPAWAEAMLYEAGLHCARTVVQASGYRISAQGGHVAAIDAADSLTGGEHHRLFVRLHRMRRMRHDFMYETAPDPSIQDLDQAHRDVEALLVVARKAVDTL